MGAGFYSLEKFILVILMTVNMAFVIGIVIVTALAMQSSGYTVSTTSEFCYKPSGDTSCESNKTINGTFYCCAEDYTQPVLSVMNKQLDEHYSEDTSNDKHLRKIFKAEKPEQKAAAHVMMDVDVIYDKNNRISILQWKSDGNRTFVKGGVELDPGGRGIKVKKGGHYFIYSHVQFSGSGILELGVAQLCHILYQYVEKPASGKPNVQKLSENLQTTCRIRRGDKAYASSYLGAVYYLKRDTTVMTNASVVNQIDKAPQSTYFGLYMI